MVRYNWKPSETECLCNNQHRQRQSAPRTWSEIFKRTAHLLWYRRFRRSVKKTSVLLQSKKTTPLFLHGNWKLWQVIIFDGDDDDTAFKWEYWMTMAFLDSMLVITLVRLHVTFVVSFISLSEWREFALAHLEFTLHLIAYIFMCVVGPTNVLVGNYSSTFN